MKNLLTEYYKKAVNELKNKNLDKARDNADTGLMVIAEGRIRGIYQEDSVIEDYHISFWIKKFWNFLEKNNLMLE